MTLFRLLRHARRSRPAGVVVSLVIRRKAWRRWRRLHPWTRRRRSGALHGAVNGVFGDRLGRGFVPQGARRFSTAAKRRRRIKGEFDPDLQLLEFAEDQLGCESVFICLPKSDVATGNGVGGGGPTATSTLVRMFSFLGFNIVDTKDEGVVDALPPVFRSTPQLIEGTVVQYDIEDSDF